MFEIIKIIFGKHKGAFTSIALINIFTLIPAATIYWLETEEHIFYYALIASVSTVTSWIFYSITKEIKSSIKNFYVKIAVLLLVLAFCMCPLLLTFYFRVALFFANFFEVIYPSIYAGPNRIISFITAFIFYNLFFIPAYLKNILTLLRRKLES
ncbi:MAG: hypothetical protein QXG86_02870 [Candidatus Woesearchaeota archaeon]